jgi:hypothetical protein
MMIIVGAGMAGLLAGSILRARIIEKQDSLTNNHSAVLRFRSTAVSDALNIPFRKVQVLKSIHPWRNPVADALAYSQKTNGSYRLRSILSTGERISERYIAPSDLIQRMADRCRITFGLDLPKAMSDGPPLISTIPMPALMDILGWRDKPEFVWRSGWNLVAKLRTTDAYCSLYVPDPSFGVSRISITGDELIAEFPDTWKPEEADMETVRWFLGIEESDIERWEVKPQTYAKILPIDDGVRKSFIAWASREHGIYSLGRFATWRPGLLLDDLVNDIRVISRLMEGKGEDYNHQLKAAK